MTTGPVTRLTDAQIAFLRAQADLIASPFMDPARFARIRDWWTDDLSTWAAHIAGHPVELGRLTPREIVLLDLALKAEPDPPTAPAVVAVRRRSAAVAFATRFATARTTAAREAEWRLLYPLLPVAVHVAHNFTSHRHVDGCEQGRDHIIVRANLGASPRLFRAAGEPLCYVLSRSHHLQHFPNLDDPDTRVPTCQICIRTAYRIADRQPSRLLLRTA